MKKLNFYFRLVFLLTFLSSCGKDESQPQPQTLTPTPEVTKKACYLSKVFDQNDVLITEIAYNNLHQHTSYVDYKSGNSYTLTYSNDKLTGISHTYLNLQPIIYTLTYELNSNGFAGKVLYTQPGNSTPSLYFPLEYSPDNKLMKTGLYAKRSVGPDEHRTSETYLFNGDNVAKFTSTVFRNPVDTTIHVTDYEYDTKPNPYARFRNFSSSVSSWSNNNPVKLTKTQYSTDGSVISQAVEGTYTWEYNSDNLPIKSTYNPANGSAPTIRKFEYTCE